MSADRIQRCDAAVLHEAYCLPALLSRKFTHAELWTLLGTIADEADGICREPIGSSAEGRPLYALRFGRGPTRVLLWSQMHGDEPSHTMALADLFTYWAREPDDPRVRRLREALTVVAVPMLNPDGAERFRRLNAQGIDLNRDARAWASPELRALRDLADRLRPHFAFNLHDQDPRKRVGDTDRLAALALMASASGENGADDEARLRSKRLCEVIRRAVEPLIGGHIARFPEEYDPQGMGEHLQRSGTSTVLLEAGYWPDDPEKQFLRTVGFVGLLGALEAIADGSYADAPLDGYHSLPEADSTVFDVLIRGGTVVVPGLEPYRADIGINFEAPLDARDGTIAAVGDLSDYTAREVVPAEGMFVHPAAEALRDGGDGRPVLSDGSPASLEIRTSPHPDGERILSIRGGALHPVHQASR